MITRTLDDSYTEREGIRNRPLRFHHYLLAFLTAVLIAGGLQLQLGIPEGYLPRVAAKYQGDPLAFLLYFLKSSILRPADFSLQCELTALFLFVLILYVISSYHEIREILSVPY